MDTKQKNNVLIVIIIVLLLLLGAGCWAYMSDRNDGMQTNTPVSTNLNGNGGGNVNTGGSVNTGGNNTGGSGSNTNQPTGSQTGLVGSYDNSSSSMITTENVSRSGLNVTVTGQAVGNWFFEASFPVEVYDNANNLIGTGYAQAQSDWMTVSLVPFVSNVTLNAPYSGPATLVLRKDNPSGEPMNDASVSYSITLP